MKKLFDTVEENNISSVKTLLKELIETGKIDEVNTENSSGNTVLHMAASKGYTSIVELLLNYGANIHAKNKDGFTALHAVSACEEGNGKTAKLLLDKGISVDEKNEDGLTALHIAAFHNKADIVHLTLEYGADVNARDNENFTPLHITTLHDNNIDIAKILLQHGADIEAKNHKNETALDIATKLRNTNMIKLFNNEDTNTSDARTPGSETNNVESQFKYEASSTKQQPGSLDPEFIAEIAKIISCQPSDANAPKFFVITHNFSEETHTRNDNENKEEVLLMGEKDNTTKSESSHDDI